MGYLNVDKSLGSPPADLEGYKKWKIEQVADKAAYKYDNSAFEYPAGSGNYFSTKSSTMLNTVGFRTGQNDSIWSYPVKVTYKTATGAYGQAELNQPDNAPFFKAAAEARMALHQAAEAVVSAILAAADIAGVDAAADAYLAG